MSDINMTPIERNAEKLIDFVIARYDVKSLDEFTCPLHRALAASLGKFGARCELCRGEGAPINDANVVETCPCRRNDPTALLALIHENGLALGSTELEDALRQVLQIAVAARDMVPVYAKIIDASDPKKNV